MGKWNISKLNKKQILLKFWYIWYDNIIHRELKSTSFIELYISLINGFYKAYRQTIFKSQLFQHLKYFDIKLKKHTHIFVSYFFGRTLPVFANNTLNIFRLSFFKKHCTETIGYCASFGSIDVVLLWDKNTYTGIQVNKQLARGLQKKKRKKIGILLMQSERREQANIEI